MNTLQHFLPELEVDKSQVKEALKAILHTILFCRSLGPVTPVDQTLHSFPNITYTSCGVREVSANINTAIESFCSNLQMVGPNLGGGQLWISFYEKRNKKSIFGLGLGMQQPSNEKIYWEQWIIPVVVNLDAEKVSVKQGAVKVDKECANLNKEEDSVEDYQRRRRRELAESHLRRCLLQVISFCCILLASFFVLLQASIGGQTIHGKQS